MISKETTLLPIAIGTPIVSDLYECTRTNAHDPHGYVYI